VGIIIAITKIMSSAAETAPVTAMASAMLFGTITFTTVALYTRSKIQPDGNDTPTSIVSKPTSSMSSKSLMEAAHNPRSSALDVTSITSIFTLLYHSSIFGLILLYAYLCEHHPPFPHATKSYDRDEFFFYTALLIVASFFTVKCAIKKTKINDVKKVSLEKDSSDRCDDDGDIIYGVDNKRSMNTLEREVAPVDDRTEILNRDQTEEWKGWMQFMFLLYHYFHAEEVYNAIRIMITCYVWMTGFGNFSFFYIKGDYSLIRVLQMLWRLNFLVIFLCLTQGTTYILYYICLLHTYFFMMVYVSMRIGKEWNHTKWGIRIKMMVLAIIIFLVWDVDTGIFQLLHRLFLGEEPILGATAGSMWEWYFRSSLDHWSTFLGMVFALNFPITSLFFRKLEAQPLYQHVAAKAAMGIVLFAALCWWITNPFMLGKFDYNQTNSYYGWIPLLAYIYFRNLTPFLRNHTLDLLHQIGKTTLETYLLQHHIWLTSNAKSLLTLIPGWPKMNFLVVSIIYVLASRRLYSLTLFLRGMILPDDRSTCIRNLVYMGAILFSFVGIAHVLKLLGILSLCAVCFISVGFGFILYYIIIQATCIETVSNNVAAGKKPKTTFFDKSLLAGALCIVGLGILWDRSAVMGATKIQPLLSNCSNFVNQGTWIPIDSCNAPVQGVGYRDYNVASLGTCSLTQDTNYVWGWTATSSSSHCRFAYKDRSTLQKQLKNRKITFVGDSLVRHLYHSFCRQLGDAGAGAYNTTMEKHSDYSRKYGSVAMDFLWAPYTSNLTMWVDELLEQSNNLDLLVLGGGAWDRLHLYNTDKEQAELHSAIDLLTRKLALLKVKFPVVWVVPTTMNSWALLSDEKRRNIREDQMESLRNVYQATGLYSNVSFVLDGKAFTAERASESYDGVHYPLSVYDAGSQILANAFDWLLEKQTTSDKFVAPSPGSMDNPYLGLLMLLFILIGIVGFDGFMGASYFAALFVPSVAPRRLYYESFSSLHTRVGLPPILPDPQCLCNDNQCDNSKSSDSPDVIEELEPFVTNGTKGDKSSPTRRIA
jgi:N-acetylneuraminate 9-O-acetyltransferase